MTTTKRAAVTILGTVLGAGVLASGTAASEGCHPTPAQQADLNELGAVGQTVLSDVLARKSYETMLADVAAQLLGQPAADVAAILDDVIQFLIDEGKIPASVADAGPSFLEHARSVQAKAHAARRTR